MSFTTFNYFYFFLCQSVQLIDKLVNLLVGCVTLALDYGFFVAVSSGI
jgi:hypothetical protein